MIDLDLPISVQLRAQALGQPRVKNIAARRENTIDLHFAPIGEEKAAHLAILTITIGDAIGVDRDLVFLQPLGVLIVPVDFLPVGGDHDTGGVMQHTQGILNRFIARADDGDRLAPDAEPIAIFAEKHAVAEAFLHSGDVWWDVKNAGGQKQPGTGVSAVLSL